MMVMMVMIMIKVIVKMMMAIMLTRWHKNVLMRLKVAKNICVLSKLSQIQLQMTLPIWLLHPDDKSLTEKTSVTGTPKILVSNVKIGVEASSPRKFGRRVWFCCSFLTIEKTDFDPCDRFEKKVWHPLPIWHQTVSDHFDAPAWYRFRTCQIYHMVPSVQLPHFFLFGLNCGNCRFRAKYAEMAGPWRDWGRLRLTKNGGGRNNSICGNLPLEHPPPIWVVPVHQDDDQEDDDDDHHHHHHDYNDDHDDWE